MTEILTQYLSDTIVNFKVSDDLPGLDYRIPLFGSIAYLVIIYGLKYLIHLIHGKSVDAKYKSGPILHFFTQVHNVVMVVISFTMFCGTIVAAYTRLMNDHKGDVFRALICPLDDVPAAGSTNITTTANSTPFTSKNLDGSLGFWIYVFHLSKYYELFDTVLLVLKRKELIFLHVYHHLVMVSITWFWMVDRWLVGAWWCVLVNSLVHTFMYYYYYISANGRRVSWKNLMTGGQIVQLWSGFLLVLYWIYVKNTHNCTQGYFAGMYSHFTNCVLIYQFCAFYVRKYLKGGSTNTSVTKKQD